MKTHNKMQNLKKLYTCAIFFDLYGNNNVFQSVTFKKIKMFANSSSGCTRTVHRQYKLIYTPTFP